MSILTDIIGILTGGLVETGSAIGEALSSMAEAVFLTGTGESQTLSTFGTLIVVFAGISLALGLSRWVINFVASFGRRNR